MNHKQLLNRSKHHDSNSGMFLFWDFSWDNEPISFDEAIAVSQAALIKGWLLKSYAHRMTDDGLRFYQLSFFKIQGEGVRGSGSLLPASGTDRERNQENALNSALVLQENKEAWSVSVNEVIEGYTKIWSRKPKLSDALQTRLIALFEKGYTVEQLIQCCQRTFDTTPRAKIKTLRTIIATEKNVRELLDLPAKRDTWLTPYYDAFAAVFPDAVFPEGMAMRVCQQLEKKHTPEKVLAEFKCYLVNCQESGYVMNMHAFGRRFGFWSSSRAPRYQPGLVKGDEPLTEKLS